MKNLPKVALIGRANVGKSTLFNRLTEQRKAIISNIAGTTRDRNYASVNWQSGSFDLIDTGGVDIIHTIDVEQEILKQTKFAANEADLILFLVDVRDGLMAQDKEVAKLVRNSRKPVILVINKADSTRLRNQSLDFFAMGFKDYVIVSAANGSGTGDLLDLIVKKIGSKPRKRSDEELVSEKNIKIAFIGKPNVGKSTLVNAILGNERVITSPMPYTTRDAQNIEIDFQGQLYTLIDTAGIRRKNKIKNPLEKFSVGQAMASIKKADVTLLISDASDPLGQQDNTLSELVIDAKSSIILVSNKWDLVADKDEKTMFKFIKYYQNFFPYLNYAPIIFVSALEKQRVKNILETAKEIYEQRLVKISEKRLEVFLKKIIKKHPPSRGKGIVKPRLYGLVQLPGNHPTFELVKDFKSDLHDSYLRFIEKQLREEFGFLGTPITIKFRKLK